jgi:hypothetical protein
LQAIHVQNPKKLNELTSELLLNKSVVGVDDDDVVGHVDISPQFPFDEFQFIEVINFFSVRGVSL